MNNSGKTALGLDANVGALLCYLGNLICALGLIYSIIVIVSDKNNKLTRFHAWQSVLLTIVPLVLAIVWAIFTFVGIVIDAAIGVPVFSILAVVLYFVMLLASLAMLVLMIISAIKAYGGEIYKIPVIGGYADSFSN